MERGGFHSLALPALFGITSRLLYTSFIPKQGKHCFQDVSLAPRSSMALSVHAYAFRAHERRVQGIICTQAQGQQGGSGAKGRALEMPWYHPFSSLTRACCLHGMLEALLGHALVATAASHMSQAEE